MCGISGIINYDRSQEIAKTELERITDAIAHRGPDGFGYWIKNNIGLGHRRLSIIDLEGSKQPMQIENDKFIITYNGEIYNYLELKKELSDLGILFTTTGDTEVVLKAYQYWGKDCLQKFRGMFAFAIVDNVAEEVFIARDHFGIKPLVYYVGEDYFMFGSEIQQFSKHTKFKKNIDVTAMSEYLNLGYIPAPITIYTDLFKLEPGNFLKVGFDGKIKEHIEYYDLNFSANNKLSYKDWVKKVEIAIDKSVNYHKIADVPYGAFLSGGIDSSLIASSLASDGNKVDVFTMGFKNKEFDEVPYAKQVAEKYNLNHHIENINIDDLETVFTKLIEHYGEPFADSSAIPTYLISKKIREKLPVVLSGDGGDEAFGGYYSYQNFLKIENPRAPKDNYKNHIKRLLKIVGKVYPTTPRKPTFSDWVDTICHFKEVDIQKCFKNDLLKQISIENDTFKKWYNKAKINKLDSYSTASYMDYKTYLHSDILTKVDIASMMNSLEVRTPLIDIEIVELMAQIPTKFKISRNIDGSWNKKMILNSIAEKRFGKDFVQRKKQGFVVPLQEWFLEDTELGNNFKKIINNPDSLIFNYLIQDEIKSVIYRNNKVDYNKVYQIYILEKWLEKNLL